VRRKYKHLFFDLDNTLWDFEGNALVALQEVFVMHNLHRFFNDFDHFHQLYTYRNRQLWEMYPQGLITRKQLDLERFLYPLSQAGEHNEALAIQLSNDYLRICPIKTKLMPHAIELLAYLKPNYKIYIISNGFSSVQKIKIQACGIVEYIDNLYLSEMVGYHKPDKRIFDYAVKSSNAKKSESIMIGDNFDADIAGAKNAGIHQIYFNPRGNTSLSFSPTYTIESLEEIKAIL
jgi:putative hydrolase of the HAD superfamily